VICNVLINRINLIIGLIYYICEVTFIRLIGLISIFHFNFLFLLWSPHNWPMRKGRECEDRKIEESLGQEDPLVILQRKLDESVTPFIIVKVKDGTLIKGTFEVSPSTQSRRKSPYAVVLLVGSYSRCYCPDFSKRRSLDGRVNWPCKHLCCVYSQYFGALRFEDLLADGTEKLAQRNLTHFQTLQSLRVQIKQNLRQALEDKLIQEMQAQELIIYLSKIFGVFAFILLLCCI
jgi:hypothetical protein